MSNKRLEEECLFDDGRYKLWINFLYIKGKPFSAGLQIGHSNGAVRFTINKKTANRIISDKVLKTYIDADGAKIKFEQEDFYLKITDHEDERSIFTGGPTFNLFISMLIEFFDLAD